MKYMRLTTHVETVLFWREEMYILLHVYIYIIQSSDPSFILVLVCNFGKGVKLVQFDQLRFENEINLSLFIMIMK